MWTISFIIALSLVSLLYMQYAMTKEISGIENGGHAHNNNYVRTESGIVRGHTVTEDGVSYRAFLGIPYAAPPLGKNRYKAPLPPAPWQGVLEANRTAMCPQTGLGDEDCLIINVFTPSKLRHPLPVLVNIHGGGYFRGTGITSGVEYILKRDVVLVTFNYRVGTLGFLCLGTEEVPGNAGMKDQVAALRWIQRNIWSFGGNSKQVTIHGSSAGGASVDLQVLSPMSNGLFRAAIPESGSATSTWPIEIDPIASATKLAASIGFTSSNLEELVDFYQNIPAGELSIANAKYQDEMTDGSLGFAPCIEKRLPGIESFITESPYDILTQGKYHKIPMMLVFSTMEGLYLKSLQYYQHNYRERMEVNFEDFLPPDLIFESEEVRTEVAQKVKEFYFGNETINDGAVDKYLEYMGDFIILHGVLKSAEYHSRHSPVYLMEFSLKSSLGRYEEFYDDKINVAGHSDMSEHAFPRAPINNAEDKRAVDTVAEIITNFVKYGNPTPRLSPLLKTFWPRVTPQTLEYMLFSRTLTAGVQPHWPSKVFWDDLYAKYRRQLMPVHS